MNWREHLTRWMELCHPKLSLGILGDWLYSASPNFLAVPDRNNTATDDTVGIQLYISSEQELLQQHIVMLHNYHDHHNHHHHQCYHHIQVYSNKRMVHQNQVYLF